MNKNKLGRKGPIPEGSQDWNSNGTGLEAGADAEHAAYWIASHGLLSLLPYRTQKHQAPMAPPIMAYALPIYH